MATPSAAQRGSRRSRWRRALQALAFFTLALLAATWISTERFNAFGGSPSAATLERMRASSRFIGDHFENLEARDVMKAGMGSTTWAWLFGTEMRAPICPLPLATDTAARLAEPPSSGLRITWLGHSTTLIEIDGQTVLTYPMWSDRASPSHPIWATAARYAIRSPSPLPPGS